MPTGFILLKNAQSDLSITYPPLDDSNISANYHYCTLII